MKLLNIAAAFAILATTAAHAQTAVEDSNADGVYSMEELMVVYPTLTEEVFLEMDTNGDGSIDAEELASAQEAGLLDG